MSSGNEVYLSLGSRVNTVNGKTVEERRQENITRTQLAAGRELTKDEVEIVRKDILSECDGSKAILKELATAYAAGAGGRGEQKPELEKLIHAQAIYRKIEECESGILCLEIEDLSRLRDGYKNITSEQIRRWVPYANLMPQLITPAKTADELTRKKDGQSD